MRHRTALKNRIHATLLAFGKPCPVSDLFGVAGRELLDRLDVSQPWRATIDASLQLIEDLDGQVRSCERELRALGADHEYVPLLMSAPGIAWVLGYTIAAEVGDIKRFDSPSKLCGYTGLCPRVHQSGERDHRGSLAKAGPKYLRWALIEAATHAACSPVYRERYQRTAKRLGRQRGKRSRAWISHASSQRRSGTCSPATNPSLRQAPRLLWPHDGPRLRCAAAASSHLAWSSHERTR